MRATAKTSPYPGTQAVQRAVGLLKAFTPERPSLRLPDLSTVAGLNKTTTYRLLSALVVEGLLERAPETGDYRLGPELLALGSRALDYWVHPAARGGVGATALRAASRAELQALAYATRETATLEVLVGRDVLILDEAAGDHVVASMPSLGTRWPAHATSTGKVMLAHLPEAALDSLLEVPLAAATPRTVVDPAALRRELSRVRARGWALASEELEAGFVAVGVPIWSNQLQGGAAGEVVAAISVGGPKSRLNQERVREILRTLPAVTARISTRLGAPGNQARGARR